MYSLASTTKPITTTALMTLVQAAQVYSSAHDLVRFGLYQLGEHLPGQVAILSADSLAQMHTAAVVDDSGGHYGLGWDVAHHSDYEVWSHTGGMPGVATELQLVPSAHLAIVVLVNNEDNILARTIAQALLTTMLPHWVPPPHPAAAPIPPFMPPPSLIGTWTGTVAIYDHELPLQLKILPSGDVHVRFGSHFETLLKSHALYRGGHAHWCDPGRS